MGRGFHEGDVFWPACDFLDSGRLVACGETELWVEEEGQGPPLLAIHGGPGVDHRSLHPGLSVLSEFRRIIYVDLRGHYMSHLPAGLPHHGLATDVADIAALCDALGLAQLDVFGHSWGGLVGLEFAGRHPSFVRRLVVCSTPIGASDEQIEARMAADTAGLALDAASDFDADEEFDLYLRFYLARDPSEGVRHWMKLVRESYTTARNSELMELRGEADSELEPDWEALLVRLDCPALVLYGEQDPIVVPNLLLGACARHENIRVHGFTDSRHDPFHDEPEQFALVVQRFLDFG